MLSSMKNKKKARPLDWHALTTDDILIISGRVPITIAIMISKSNCSSANNDMQRLHRGPQPERKHRSKI